MSWAEEKYMDLTAELCRQKAELENQVKVFKTQVSEARQLLIESQKENAGLKEHNESLSKLLDETTAKLNETQEELMERTARELILDRINGKYYNNNRQYNFREDLLNYLNITDHPKADLLYSKAYEMGHACGYHEVLNYAEDLVELIR